MIKADRARKLLRGRGASERHWDGCERDREREVADAWVERKLFCKIWSKDSSCKGFDGRVVRKDTTGLTAKGEEAQWGKPRRVTKKLCDLACHSDCSRLISVTHLIALCFSLEPSWTLLIFYSCHHPHVAQSFFNPPIANQPSLLHSASHYRGMKINSSTH